MSVLGGSRGAEESPNNRERLDVSASGPRRGDGSAMSKASETCLPSHQADPYLRLSFAFGSNDALESQS